MKDSGLDLRTRAFLGLTYNLKSIADYEIGPDAKVTLDMARESIASAQCFVAAIVNLLPQGL